MIGSLVPTQHKNRLDIPLGEFSVLDDPRLDGVTACRTKKVAFGMEVREDEGKLALLFTAGAVGSRLTNKLNVLYDGEAD